MSDEDENDGILSRWSQRKRAAANSEVERAHEEPSQNEHDTAPEARELELVANREAAEEIDLDTIDEESDLSLFMKEGVPETLKKAALAKLWRSNPVFANIDGLVDYDDNFADPNLIMKTFTSAYQVGKGYLKEVLEEDESDAVAATSSEEETEIAENLEETETQAELAELDVANIEESFDTEASNEPDLPHEVETSSVSNVPLRIRLGLADAAD